MNESPLNHDENLQKAERIAYLIAGHVSGTLTGEESDELDEWVTESDENLELFEKLTDEDNIEAAMHNYQQIEKEKTAALAGIKTNIGLDKEKGLVRKLWPYLIAASVVLIAGSLYFINYNNQNKLFQKHIAQAPIKNDVKAGTDKAVLTLSDSRTIILDSTGSGLLASEGTTSITASNPGELMYKGTGNKNAYNHVATPRGGQYKIVLNDGTKVWLNAESSLKFPVGFATTSREVELSGEGYFEVAKVATKPFIVKINTANGDGGHVTVLGTHFNINSYGDEGAVITTLLEGSVEVQRHGVAKKLQPGERSIATTTIQVAKADVDEAVAWKEGKFLFRDATVRSIGEQIKRWYDVDVEYVGNVAQHFNTEVDRKLPLSKLLDGLEATGQVQFVLDGRKLIIKP